MPKKKKKSVAHTGNPEQDANFLRLRTILMAGPPKAVKLSKGAEAGIAVGLKARKLKAKKKKKK